MAAIQNDCSMERVVAVALALALLGEVVALVLVSNVRAVTPNLLTALLASTITAAISLVAVYFGSRFQAKRVEEDRVRIAYKQLIRASNRIKRTVDELYAFPKGRPPLGGATIGPADHDPFSEASALAKEAEDLSLEAQVALSLESHGEMKVYDAFQRIEDSYWKFIGAVRTMDRPSMEEHRRDVEQALGELVSAARGHLAKLT